jgi:hypothetical protein
MQALAEALPQRPEPPDHLSEEEAAVWRAVVGRMPATWFTAEMLPLLENHCCHVCLAKDLMAEMRQVKRALARLEKELEPAAPGRTKLRKLIREDRSYLHELLVNAPPSVEAGSESCNEAPAHTASPLPAEHGGGDRAAAAEDALGGVMMTLFWHPDRSDDPLRQRRAPGGIISIRRWQRAGV